MVEHSLSKLVLKEDVVLQEALEVVDHRLTLVVEVVPHILVMVVGHIPEMGEGHKMLTLEQLVVVHSQKEGEKEEEEEVIHEE